MLCIASLAVQGATVTSAVIVNNSKMRVVAVDRIRTPPQVGGHIRPKLRNSFQLMGLPTVCQRSFHVACKSEFAALSNISMERLAIFLKGAATRGFFVLRG
jgi:hypothetical protein